MTRLPTHPVDLSDPNLRGPAQARDMTHRISTLERGQSFGPGHEIDFQRINGGSESYNNVVGTVYAPLDYNGTGQNMTITYTPPVPVWWEVTGHIGIMGKLDAAYHYAYGSVQLNVPDLDGVQIAHNLVTQNLQVNQYEARVMHRRFKLSGGSTYQVFMSITTQGGSWQYYRGTSHLWLEATAITR